MKISVICMRCSHEDFFNSRATCSITEVREDNRYITTCPNGHTNVTLLQVNKFELLFEIGANAIVDGYYREAVGSFTAALERFYEFFVKVQMIHNKFSPHQIDEIWKTISNLSERQLGAFVHAYGNAFKKAPKLLGKNPIEFRNKVTHNGLIPDKEKAINYGQQVINVIHPIILEIKQYFLQAMYDLQSHQLMETSQENDFEKYGNPTTHCPATVLNTKDGTEPPITPDLVDRLDLITRLRTVER